MKRYHIIFWIGLGLFTMTLSYKLGLGKFNNPGPGFMPFLLSLLLSLVSLFFLISHFFEKSATFGDVKEEKEKSNFWKIGLVVTSLFIYALLFERLGYIIATLLLLIILFRSFGSKWRFALINSILCVLISYFFFTFLGVRFPAGIFKILVGFVR